MGRFEPFPSLGLDSARALVPSTVVLNMDLTVGVGADLGSCQDF